MKMTILTGDTHRRFERINKMCDKFELTEDDLLIILGDAGINFYDDEKDKQFKNSLSAHLPVRILCIYGNHEIRPETLDTYHPVQWNGGIVYREFEFPRLLFAKDGEIYDIDGKKCIAIGGAYSIDKWQRIENGWGWWDDEQPSDEIKQQVESRLEAESWKVDIVLSHTAPLKYEPRELWIGKRGIPQHLVDKTTEKWLDTIEDKLTYDLWYCGHYHTNKSIDKMRFLYDTYLNLDDKYVFAKEENDE